ncbi:MAG: serine hydrolase domain-containing protein [Chloroflexota bacterium]
MTAFLLPVLLLGTLGPALQQQPTLPPRAWPAMNRIMRRDLAAYRVPGSVFVLVQGDHRVLVRGYGDANIARRERATGSTEFRLGATSSVVTAAAALDLVEHHRLRLHVDVNRELRLFHLAPNYPRPVTLANLLTSTAGLDERHSGRRVLSPRLPQPLARFLGATLPPRVEPPGRVYDYSAFGFALAGYLVQQAARMPFARYTARRLFEPLHMDHSTFQQPLPSGVASRLATGYDSGSHGAPRPAPLEYFNLAPAAGMVSTGNDMADFLEGLLHHGVVRGHRVLPAGLVRSLEARHYSSYPRIAGFPPMPAVAYGFGRFQEDGTMLVEASGAVRGFSSLLAVMPRRHIGFFLAGNTANTNFLFDVQRRLLQRFFPDRRPARSHPLYRSGNLSGLTGSYWTDDYSHTTLEKLDVLGSGLRVSAAGSGKLIARSPGKAPVRLRRVAPLLFEVDRGQTYWAFQTDSKGQVSGVVTGGNSGYLRAPWYGSESYQIPYLAVLLLIFLSAVAVWLVGPLAGAAGASARRKGSGQQNDGPVGKERPWSYGRPARWVGRIIGIDGALILIFVVVTGIAMESAAGTASQHYSWLEYSPPIWLYVLLTVPIVTTILALVSAVGVVLAWPRVWWSLARRLHATLAVLAGLAFIPFLSFWNLLGYHL